MEKPLFKNDLLTAHKPVGAGQPEFVAAGVSPAVEPGILPGGKRVRSPGIPGGETPPSTAGGTPAATEGRFMESGLFEIDLLTGHEPWSEDERERPSPRPSPASGRGRNRSAAFAGLGQGLAGMEGDGLFGEAWPSRRVSYATPSPLGEGWGEGLAERFMGSRVGEGAMPTDHEPRRDSPRRHRGTE